MNAVNRKTDKIWNTIFYLWISSQLRTYDFRFTVFIRSRYTESKNVD